MVDTTIENSPKYTDGEMRLQALQKERIDVKTAFDLSINDNDCTISPPDCIPTSIMI